MPEFEEENVNNSQSQTYTPSTDASVKPRTRRRSGGFKTDAASAASASNAKMGEVDPVQALKEEKLSGQPSADQPRGDRSERPARRERSERSERAPREPREPRESRATREPREPRAPRSDATPQPSPETLAAIARVEAKITERRAGRDVRRSDRDKKRPEQSGRPAAPGSSEQSGAKAAPGGLIAAIGGFFRKLFGKAPQSAPKKSGARGGRPQGSGDNRQNRRPGGGRGGRGPGGDRGAQGRTRGGKGPRRSDRRSNEPIS